MWHGRGQRDGLGAPEQVSRRKRSHTFVLKLRACVCAHESERLDFNCSLVAKYNKVRVQRIEVILSSGLNCFFPKGRGGR